MKNGRGTKFRAIRVIAVNVALLVFATEVVSAVYAFFVFGETYLSMDEARSSVRTYLPPAMLSEVVQEIEGEAAAAAEEITLNDRMRPHPFWAYTYDPRAPGRTKNRAGFYEYREFPYVKAHDEFVVGIFGGSVAMGLGGAESRSVLENALLEHIGSKGFSKVTVLIFAQGGFKQPQTLHAFLYYIDMLDMAIFLDGLNEISSLPSFSELAEYELPFDFPVPHLYESFFAEARTMDRVTAMLETARLRERQHQWLDAVSSRPLRYSMTCHALWRSMNSRLENRARDLQSVFASEESDDFATIDRSGMSNAAIAEDFFETLANRIRIAWAAGQLQGKPVVHFLQPNQYLDDSKPLTSEEKAVALDRRNTGYHIGIVTYYPYLQEMSKKLRDQEVASYDLSMVFADNDETLYYDSCCHLSQRGMSLIAEEMARQIGLGGLLDEVKAATLPPAPENPGTEILTNASFEEWSQGWGGDDTAAYPTAWVPAGGLVSRSADHAVDGKYSLRLDPAADDVELGSRIFFVPNALTVDNPREIHFRAYVKAGSSKLGAAVFAEVKGEMTSLTTNPATGAPAYINYAGQGGWALIQQDIPVPEGTDFESLRLFFMLRRGAAKPAFIDKVSLKLEQ